MGNTFKEFLDEQMRDPEFKAEFERVSAEEEERCTRLMLLEREVVASAVAWRAAELAVTREQARWGNDLANDVHGAAARKREALDVLREAVDALTAAEGGAGAQK